MKNFKTVPLPDNMKNCETDPRGLPVPYVVFQDSNGKFHFKVNDSERQLQCMMLKMCHICGNPLKEDMWMLGGPGSSLDKYGYYVDGPVHYVCGRYALQVCPYLSYKGYNSSLDLEKIQAQISSSIILHNPTVDQDRVPLFVFGKTKSVKWFKDDSGGVGCIPKKPFEALEFWDDGHQLTTREEVISRMKGTKWEKYLITLEEQYEDAPQQDETNS